MTPSLNSFLGNYTSITVILILGVIVAIIMVLFSAILGPRRHNPYKDDTYESGLPTEGFIWQAFDVKYYIIALLFLLFDLECVFMYPWAVYFKQLGAFGLVEMFIFMFILLVGLIYVWKKGALEWD
jgi:NADH-quinone oxidoreductase subunit A